MKYLSGILNTWSYFSANSEGLKNFGEQFFLVCRDENWEVLFAQVEEVAAIGEEEGTAVQEDVQGTNDVQWPTEQQNEAYKMIWKQHDSLVSLYNMMRCVSVPAITYIS